MLTVGIGILARGDEDGRQTSGSVTMLSVGGAGDHADYAVTAPEAAGPGAGTPG
jgi:hypothetical protein